MSSIHIREVNPKVLARLKRLAVQHHRSLQGELHAILEQAARFAPEERAGSLKLHVVNTGQKKAMGRDEIYEDYR